MENDNLNFLEIKNILKTYYNLNVQKIIKMNHSSSLCYTLICDEGKYFIKIFNSHKNVLKINQEYYLLKYLKNKGFDVPLIRETNLGDIFIHYKDYYMFVENYIVGKECNDDNFSNKLLLDSSRLLGKIHFNLNGVYDDEKKEFYWKDLDLDKEYAFLDSIVDMFRGRKINSKDEIVLDAISHKRRLINDLKKMSKDFNGLTYLMTHGDYSKRNLLLVDDELKVVDFSDSGVYPASWELIRSYFFSTNSCMKNKGFDFNLFNDYANAYASEFNLNKSDIKYMPYLFLYQILISRYGYREYINNRDESFLDFIVWKDNIINFLEHHGDEIVKRVRI